jgi:PAS domain S-box-containing protein
MVLWGQDSRHRLESPLLLWLANSFFLASSVAAALLAGAAYIGGAPPALLGLGCGVTLLGICSFTGMVCVYRGDTNAGIIIHNLGALTGAGVHILAASHMLRAGERPASTRRERMAQCLFAAAAVAGVIFAIALAARSGILPEFVRPDGGTHIRTMVLATAFTGYLVAAALLLLVEHGGRDRLLRWYWIGLVLIAVGLGSVALAVVSSPLSWTGRFSQALGLTFVLTGLCKHVLGGRRRSLGDAFVHLEKTLREVEGRYDTLFGNSSDGILLVSSEGGVLRANPAACRLFASEEASLLGRPMTALLAQGEDTGWLERGETREGRCLCDDGGSFEAELTAIAPESGGVRFVLVRDIGERRRAAAEMRAAREAAERALKVAEAARADAQRASKAKDEFIAALSHELRTPLTPVLAAASTLKDDQRLPEWARAELQMIQRNVGLEVQLIADLLDVTRIAADKLVLHRRPVDVARILHEAARICACELDARNQRLTIHMPGAPYLMNGDEPRLHQVFWNLIKNASKFTPAGGSISVNAEVSRVEGGGLFDCLCVRVTDTGCGLSPESIPRLFRSFEQGNREVTRHFGGLGLGLAICKAVVEGHGGRISASSEGRGHGATFTVELPLATLCEMPAPSVASQGADAAAAMPLRILLVEDHEDTARILCRLLTARGHGLTLAASVRDGVQLALASDFDLLLSDLGLPDGDGCDLLRQLAAAGRPIRAIALSGYGTVEDVERSKLAGFLEHLTKPVDFERLIEAVQRVGAELRGERAAGETA